MQNTMVRGGGGWSERTTGGKKLGEGERRKEENYIKKGKKTLKMHLLWL